MTFALLCRSASRWLCVVGMALALSACETTGSGQLITDTGKTRAAREKAARDTRPIMREAAPPIPESAASAGDAHSPAPQERPVEVVPETVDGAGNSAGLIDEDVTEPTTPLVTDAGGAPAVLVDVVRPAAGAALESYEPVGDEELGAVQVTRSGNAVAVQRGMALAIGDELVTAADSVVILNYPPNIEIYVMPSTQIRVGSIFVKLGEIWVSIKGKLKEKFKVETEFVTAGVEGTEFLFRADAAGDVDVDVMKGVVLCTSKLGRWAPVRMARMQKFIARRDVGRPIMRNLAANDVALVRARVKPVSVAVATKLTPRKVITLDKQILYARPIDAGTRENLPAIKNVPDTKARPVSEVPVKPDLRTAPSGGTVITKPPVTTLPAGPELRTPPKPSAPITKPPVTPLPARPELKTLPKPDTSITKPPGAATLPKSTTVPLRTLPKDSDLMRAQ